MKGMLPSQKGLVKLTMIAPKTISLHSTQESAAIKILKGIHQIYPVASFSFPNSDEQYQVFVLDDWDIIHGIERAYTRADKIKDNSESIIIWAYVNDHLIGEELESGTSFKEAYCNVAG